LIIARSPLRISLGGGGTDLPSYYREHEGFLIAAAIDKYVYVTINRPFNEGIYLKYSEIEHVKTVDEVSHNIIREALKLENLNTPQVEISSIADLPSGTGLGSSGSFTTALLKALYAYRHRHINPEELAELACAIEIDRLKEPIGKQDQYIASVGGITCFAFHKDNSVTFAPLKISRETFHKLEDNLLLFFTGFSRSASEILKDQHIKSQKNDVDMLNNLHFVKEIGYLSKDALE
jgi:D-glycero-alpha-D-manno-heptose-7-phosphate kinase